MLEIRINVWRCIVGVGTVLGVAGLVALVTEDPSPVLLVGFIVGFVGAYLAGFSASVVVRDSQDIKLDEEIRELCHWADEDE